MLPVHGISVIAYPNLDTQSPFSVTNIHQSRDANQCKIQKFSNTAKLHSMEATLSLNSRGVITLPAKMRQMLGLKADDLLIAETTPEGILLRPTVTLPLELYSDARVAEFDAAEQELAQVLAGKA